MRNYTFFFFSWLWIMDLIFFTLNIALYETMFSCKFHQFVCLSVICISQQYEFTTMGLEGFPIVSRNYGPCLGAKNSHETLRLSCPINASKGVSSITYLWGTLFWIYEAQLTSSTHIYGGRFLASRRHVAIYFKVLFFLSATPLCCGVYGTECCNWMSGNAQSC